MNVVMQIVRALIGAGAVLAFAFGAIAPGVARATDALDAALTEFGSDPHRDLHSVIVIRNGQVLAERYYGRGDRDTLIDVRSAGKSVTSLLVGIALDRGEIRRVEDPVQAYWPEAAAHAIGPVRLVDLLTMRSGLDADADDPETAGHEDRLDEAEDPLAVALAVPAIEKAGTRYRYNSMAAYVVGIVVARATGRSLEDFAREHLFDPLEIDAWRWQADQGGHTKGQGNLFLTARGFARIGEMVLEGGSFRGRRVVSRAWIDRSLEAQVEISAWDPFARSYGYFWYRTRHPAGDREVDVYFASGNGGNKIYVVPETALVVSVMSRAYGQGYAQRRSERILRAVLAALSPDSRDAPAPPSN